MLNNKRSLLQKVRIAMVAIVTILSIGGAYAMKAPANQAGTTWGVLATNANTYRVTAVTAGSDCDNAPQRACKVNSTAMPDANGLIPKAGATLVQSGAFIQ
jgi:hypothetical protein